MMLSLSSTRPLNFHTVDAEGVVDFEEEPGAVCGEEVEFDVVKVAGTFYFTAERQREQRIHRGATNRTLSRLSYRK